MLERCCLVLERCLPSAGEAHACLPAMQIWVLKKVYILTTIAATICISEREVLEGCWRGACEALVMSVCLLALHTWLLDNCRF